MKLTLHYLYFFLNIYEWLCDLSQLICDVFQRWSEAVLIKLISKIPIKFCNTCRWVHLTNCMTHLYVRWNSNYSMKYVLIFKNYNNLHYIYICSYLHLPICYITALIYFSKLRCFSFVCVCFFWFSVNLH